MIQSNLYIEKSDAVKQSLALPLPMQVRDEAPRFEGEGAIKAQSFQSKNPLMVVQTPYILREGCTEFVLTSCVATSTTMSATLVMTNYNRVGRQAWEIVTIGGLMPFGRYKFMTTARRQEEYFFEGNHLGIGRLNFPALEEVALTVWKCP